MANENIKSDELSKEIKVKIYYCRNCKRHFVPKFFKRLVNSFDQKLLLKEPDRCTKCRSRWWKIWLKDRIKCFRCGYNIDETVYKGKMPLRCPNCRKRRYLEKDFEEMLNYSKEIRRQFIIDYKLENSKNKPPKIIKFKPTDAEFTKFNEKIVDEKDNIEERLK